MRKEANRRFLIAAFLVVVVVLALWATGVWSREMGPMPGPRAEGFRIACWFVGIGASTIALGMWLAVLFDRWALLFIFGLCGFGIFITYLGLVGLLETWPV